MTNAVDSLPVPVERPGHVVSDPIPQPRMEDLPRFAERPGFLTDINARADSETHVSHVNGSSDERSIDLGRFLVVRPLMAVPGEYSRTPQEWEGVRFGLASQSMTREYSRTLQKWEGYVTEIRDDVFRAVLTPIVGGGGEEEAEIYLEEVDPDDRPLIEPGAVFYWSIGYTEKPSGRQRVSILRFRRLPTWTRRELNEAEGRTASLRDLFPGD